MADARPDRPERKSFQISEKAHKEWLKVCEGRAVGRTMYDAGTRLIEWFCRQPPLVQTAIMSDVDRGMEHAYAAALELLAAELRSDPPGADPPPKEKPAGAKPRRKLRIGDTSGRVFEV